MTMQAAIYGRIGQAPRSIDTKSGKTMVVASVAVNIGDHDDPTLWVGIVAFGRAGEELLRHDKGDLVSASGRVQRNSWTSPSGEKREQLQVVADSVISSRTVRPNNGRNKSGGGERQAEPEQRNQRELDDEIPF